MAVPRHDVSLLIALAAAGFTGMQWHEARNQLLLSTKPHVDFETDDDPDEPSVDVAIRNAGSGPATIKSVTFYVDRKPVLDADDAGTTYAHLSESELGYKELEPDDTWPSAKKYGLYNIESHGAAKSNQKNVEKFADFVSQNLAIEIKFCSVIQEDFCWIKCSAKGRCS